MRSVELFAGAGGLAIGMANAGFHHAAVIERDAAACATFRENQRHHLAAVEGWALHEINARRFDYGSIKGEIEVVSGGPPCQPFSISGKHQARDDARDMFPEAIRAVRELRPKAFIFENVKGLMRRSFADYFSYLQLQLQHPDVVRKKGEWWTTHRRRLERHHTASDKASTYNIVVRTVNAADYGVPQRRERVFIVGFRSDVGAAWSFPEPTHSEDALLASKWIEGDYWDVHEPPTLAAVEAPPVLHARLDRIREQREVFSPLGRWRTVRDALVDLPDPELYLDNEVVNHRFTPGARTYHGHTGSDLDDAAKTLKAGRHGVPGGENMFVKDDGTVRYFTVREAARLQTFPDEFEFTSTWTQTMRQLGNAVPVLLAEKIASSVARSLQDASRRAAQGLKQDAKGNPQ
jgi:DNA (cytosine-5)-methyltransferase 1